MSQALERYAKRQARKWVRILREKWGIEKFSVGRDGSVKYGDLIFASFRLGQNFVRWEILSYPSQELQTLLCPTIVFIRRHYLCIAEQFPPKDSGRMGTQFFLALAFIHHILSEKFGRSLRETISQGINMRVVYSEHVGGVIHGQYIEVGMEEWERVGKEGANYYLRFPTIDETTEPDDYTVYFVIDERGKTEALLPIPYTQLLRLEPENFLQLAALTAL
jgi:hypothetical protein